MGKGLKYIRWFNLLIICTILFASCKGNDNNPTETGDITIGTPVASVTDSAVQLQATLSQTGDVTLAKRGFCYNTSANPTIYNSTVTATGDKTFTATIGGLLANTTYYVRAFVNIYNGETVYSPETSFTTPEMNKPDDPLAQYKPPTYPDDYTGIAAWNQRSQWNLANVHDPTVMKADDGYYYMYQTDASYGNVTDGHGHFHARRSKDLVNWEYLGATMNDAPGWIKTKLNEIRAGMGLAPIDNPGYGYWAPVARKVAPGKYRMYYSIPILNYIKSGAVNSDANFDNSWSERAFIGIMETADPASNVWQDKGYAVCSSTDKNLNWSRSSLNDWNAYFKWNAIDPTYIITQSGEHWLIYGSWHSGIVALQLNPDTGAPLNDLGNPWDINALPNYGKLVATRNASSRWQGSEAPEIIYNPKTEYYYLFTAYDELTVAYNTRVCRSKNITGPYLGIDGTNITTGGEMFPVVTHPYKFNNSNGWVGISHCAVFDDGSGNWFYSSQGRLPVGVPGINASNAVMMGQIRSIRWTSDGWPVVMPERYGAVPQVPIKESELVGNWEHIDLSYNYGKQDAATTMTLSADHTITAGTWKGGTWSYDAANQILTANGVELCIQREVDWEASPRVATIVFAGYNAKKTYWGKKVK